MKKTGIPDGTISIPASPPSERVSSVYDDDSASSTSSFLLPQYYNSNNKSKSKSKSKRSKHNSKESSNNKNGTNRSVLKCDKRIMKAMNDRVKTIMEDENWKKTLTFAMMIFAVIGLYTVLRHII